MSRLTLRLRLTVLFAAAVAVVLLAFGTFVHSRLEASLVEQADDQLAARAATVLASVPDDGPPTTLPGDDEQVAQLLGPEGTVVAGSPGARRPLLDGRQLRRTRLSGRLTTETTLVPVGQRRAERLRLLARPAAQGVLVVGVTLDDVDEALAALRRQLLVGGPVALLVTSLLAYLLAGAALRPVEAMRRRALQISADTSGERLPLPRARDEVHHLGTSLNAMLDRLDAGLDRERRFVAEAGHELRTPLALLRTEIDLALRRPRSAAELEAALRSVGDDVDRLGRLATALLLLATSQDGTVALHREPVEVTRLLDDVAARFATTARELGRAVDVSAPPELVVHADRVRLDQALSNVLDNALRHGVGRVLLRAEAVDGEVHLSVRDEGGYPEDLLPVVFDRFTRAGSARATEGSGLGMSVVDAVARSHGGSAWARNLDGGGAEAGLRIPSGPHLP